MFNNSTQSTPTTAAEETKLHSGFKPPDPVMEMLLRGLLHELRNPLSSILTAATLLHDSPLPDAPDLGEESRMLLDVVRKESLRLNHILTEFAGYIKLPQPQPHSFDLTQTMRVAVRGLQREGVLQASIHVIEELPESCPVWADESQIRMALGHILRNAGEAMPDGGELCISTVGDETGANITVCIADNGKGFTSESRDRAFQPFYSSKSQSLGLGLSATRSLIEAAEGRIWLEEDFPTEKLHPEISGLLSPTVSMRVCLELPRAKF